MFIILMVLDLNNAYFKFMESIIAGVILIYYLIIFMIYKGKLAKKKL
ncbi:MAG: hypothetical protein RR325_01335 [Bacilli bacterium]